MSQRCDCGWPLPTVAVAIKGLKQFEATIGVICPICDKHWHMPSSYSENRAVSSTSVTTAIKQVTDVKNQRG